MRRRRRRETRHWKHEVTEAKQDKMKRDENRVDGKE